MAGAVIQVNISSGGMPKLAVAQAKVTFDGLTGDWQKNRKYHGGRDRAVCLYSQELYQWLRETHNIDLLPGSVGENFTTTGLDLQSLTKGDRLQVGNCVIELTDIRVPCKNLNQWDPQLLKVIQGHSGWMAKVITEGEVFPGDIITREQ
jgi:MOSC domain-containing protein YiiM